MSDVFLRSAYNYDRDAVSKETGLKCQDESLTQQHQKDEADINTIVKRFHLSGELPTDVRAPRYGDFTGVVDYQSALNAVIAADESFMAMPAYIRARFNNDTQLFVEFCSDPANTEEMIKLGLAVSRTAGPEGSETPEDTPSPPPAAKE